MIQHHVDSSAAVRCQLVWCIVCCVFLLLPLIGSSWAWCQFYGIGLGSMWVNVSLTHLTVDITCKKNYIEDVICKVAAKIGGKHSLTATYQLFCQPHFAPAACEAATALYWNSYVVIFANITACVLQVLAGLFLFYYWHVAHLSRIKSWAITFMFSSLVIAASGLAMWTALCPHLSQMPTAWSNTMYGLSGSHLFSVRANSALIQYGSTWFLDLLGIVLLLTSLASFSCTVHAHEDEQAAELLEQTARANARDEATAAALGFDFQPGGYANW